MIKYTDEQTKKAKAHFKYGIDCDIFSEPVLTYAKIAVEALNALDLINRQEAEIEELKETLNATIAGQETLQKYIPIAKSEAIKEFWNQRPPMLNPNFKGKEQYNKGWNDCISFFAEEYKIFLGIEKRNEKDCPDTAEEMVGEGK